MAFEIGKTSSGAKYVVGNNGNTVYLSQAGIKIKNELIAGANKYVVYVLNVTDVIYSGPLDTLLYNGGPISSDPKIAIDFLVSEGWVNFKPGSSGGGGTFDPSMYDLAAFKNQSTDPFTQESDLLNKADLVSGKVPASQLPSYVDDVIEGADLSALNALPDSQKEIGKLYVALDTNKVYRWSGSTFVDMTPGEADTLQTVTTRNPVTSNTITIAGLYATALPTLDSTFTKNIVAKFDGTFGWQDIITHYNTVRLSYYSGRYGNMMTSDGLLNMFIGGSSSLKDLTTITGQENTLLTYSDTFDLTSGTCNLGIGYQSGSQLTSGSWNVFLGRRAGKNITTGTNNIIIGSNGASGTDVTFPSTLTNYIQILSGTAPIVPPANNKLNIGNWIFGDDGNIGIGVAPTNKLDVNGNIRVRSLLNAQGDATFTKNLVAKPDGTFGVEDKTNLTTLGGVLPSIRMLDYTEDATNYMLRVSYTYGQAVPSGNPIFEVRIYSSYLLAQNITTTQDSINQSTASTQNGVTINGFVVTILIPKATNTSPAWNNDIVGIMVRLLSVDNGDGGNVSAKIVRRIASDMSTIGFLRPKQTLLTSGSNIKTINGTSLLGSGDILTNPISTVLVFNAGASLGALNANTTVDINLNTNSTWSVSALASKTGAVVANLISSTGSILDTSDKNLNIFRVVIEVSYAGGGADGTIDASIVNPSGVVIDQDIKGVNLDGVAATNQRLSFRFFAVKTSDNNAGYTLRLRCGAKTLTAYRIVSILRNNNN